MPGIPKGAKLTEQQKKKLQKMKKDGASKSEMSRVRMALLRGHSFAKAKRMSANVRQDEKRAVSKALDKKKGSGKRTKAETLSDSPQDIDGVDM